MRAAYANEGGNPQIVVTWQPDPAVPLSRVLEYHVYRGDVLIGAALSNARTFVDSVSLGGTSFAYTALEFNGGETSLPTRYLTVAPLTTGVPHIYRVTALYQTSDDRIVETSLGQSEAATLPVL